MLRGNAGTDSTRQFLGTTDNQALSWRTNGQERLRIQANGDVWVDDGLLALAYKAGQRQPAINFTDVILQRDGASGGLVLRGSPLNGGPVLTLANGGLKFSDQTVLTSANVITRAWVDGNGHLQVTLANGSTIDAGLVQGKQGDKGRHGDAGVSVTGMTVNPTTGAITVKLSDNTTVSGGTVTLPTPPQLFCQASNSKSVDCGSGVTVSCAKADGANQQAKASPNCVASSQPTVINGGVQQYSMAMACVCQTR